MKRISCLLLSLLLALLCACGDTSAPAPSDQTEPDGNEAPAAVPEVCRLYYDYAGLAVIAPSDSKLPLAAGASHGAPDYLPLWHNGEYGQLAVSGGEGYTVPELTGGKASEEGAYGGSAGMASCTTASTSRRTPAMYPAFAAPPAASCGWSCPATAGPTPAGMRSPLRRL